MKVLVITYFEDTYNFGQRLQCFALCRTLEKLHVDYDVLTYLDAVDTQKYFSEFNNKYFRSFKHVNDVKINDYDKVIIGSDQFVNRFNSTGRNSTTEVIEFIVDNIKKKPFTSYGISFGDSIKISSKLANVLQQLDVVVCRELHGVVALQNIGVNASYGIDPIFLLDRSEWQSIEKKPDIAGISAGEFDVEYYVSPIGNASKDYVAEAQSKYRISDNVQLVTLKTFSRRKATVVGPDEFIWLVHNARMVYTSSFHCLALSIMFNKRTSFRDYVCKMTRTQSLAKNIGLKFNPDGTLSGYEDLLAHIEEERRNGLELLQSSLVEDKHVPCKDMKLCTGCMLCKNACKSNAISYAVDDTLRYPKVDIDICINCSECKSVCPALNSGISSYGRISARYIVNGRIEGSSSSGLCFELARTFIVESNRAVYGVEWSPDCMHAFYSRAVDPVQCKKFKGSKYIEASEIPFDLIAHDLEHGIKALVFGLPCTLAALRQKFGFSSNLVLVQLLCNSITKPKFHRSIAMQELAGKLCSDVININQRAHVYDAKKWNVKKPGSGYTFIYTKNGKPINCGHDFFEFCKNDAAVRPSCIDCKFQDGQAFGDIVVGDPNLIPAAELPNKMRMNNSIAIVASEAGLQLFDYCLKHSSLQAFPYSGEMYSSLKPMRKRQHE